MDLTSFIMEYAKKRAMNSKMGQMASMAMGPTAPRPGATRPAGGMGDGMGSGMDDGMGGGLLDMPTPAPAPPGPQVQQQYRAPGMMQFAPQGMQNAIGAAQGFVPAMQDRAIGMMPQGTQEFLRMVQQKRDANGFGRPQRQQQIGLFNDVLGRS